MFQATNTYKKSRGAKNTHKWSMWFCCSCFNVQMHNFGIFHGTKNKHFFWLENVPQIQGPHTRRSSAVRSCVIRQVGYPWVVFATTLRSNTVSYVGHGFCYIRVEQYWYELPKPECGSIRLVPLLHAGDCDFGICGISMSDFCYFIGELYWGAWLWWHLQVAFAITEPSSAVRSYVIWQVGYQWVVFAITLRSSTERYVGHLS